MYRRFCHRVSPITGGGEGEGEIIKIIHMYSTYIQNVYIHTCVCVRETQPEPCLGGLSHGGIIMERPRGVNCIRPGGGSALCTLHPGEGLYG